METFKIKSRPELEFRPAFKSAIEILSFQLTTDFKNPDIMSNSLTWLLERVEVNLLGQWSPMKETGRNVYYPDDLKDDVIALNEIALQMFAYVRKVFQKSAKSK